MASPSSRQQLPPLPGRSQSAGRAILRNDEQPVFTAARLMGGNPSNLVRKALAGCCGSSNQERIRLLEATNADLQAEQGRLRARNKALEDRLAETEKQAKEKTKDAAAMRKILEEKVRALEGTMEEVEKMAEGEASSLEKLRLKMQELEELRAQGFMGAQLQMRETQGVISRLYKEAMAAVVSNLSRLFTSTSN